VAGQVSLAIYNLLGQRLRVLVHDQRAAGVHTALWDGLDEAGQAVSSGVYFYRFRSDGLVETHSMVLLK
jgi:flagellar hook assembly protein FlgD